MTYSRRKMKSIMVYKLSRFSFCWVYLLVERIVFPTIQFHCTNILISTTVCLLLSFFIEFKLQILAYFIIQIYKIDMKYTSLLSFDDSYQEQHTEKEVTISKRSVLPSFPHSSMRVSIWFSVSLSQLAFTPITTNFSSKSGTMI